MSRHEGSSLLVVAYDETMGMTVTLLAVGPHEFEDMRRSPEKVANLFSDSSLARLGDRDAQRAHLVASILLFEKIPAMEPVTASLSADLKRLEERSAEAAAAARPRSLALGKSWHALELLLASASPAARRSVLGDEAQPIGPGLAFGPAHYLSPDQVDETARAMVELDAEHVVDRPYRAGILRDARVHGGVGRDPSNDDDLEILREQLKALVTFYRDAASHESVVIAAVQ
jgi:hypothetical protein